MKTRMLISVMAAGLMLVAAGSIGAGPPGTWTRVSETNGRNIDEVASARTADGVLHVVYTRQRGTVEDLLHARIGADGRMIGDANAVQTGWSTIGNPDLVRTADGSLRAFWGGIRSTASGDDNDALNTANAPASGASWSLQSGHAAADNSAYASPSGAGMATDGTPVSAWGTTFGTRVHFGTNPHQGDVTVQTPCCGYSPDVAVDASGQAYVGWYSNATNEAGLYVQAVSPGGIVGGKLHVPGSATADRRSALSIDQRTAIVARSGGGVYVGYGSGYPTFTTVNIWRVGSAAPSIRIPAGGAQDVNLTAAPDGRLWLMWHASDRLYFARTNRAATRVGKVRVIAAPSGTSSIWKLNGEGSLGALDAFASVSTSGSLATWHQQVLPALEVKATGGKKKATLVVTDAGDPVAGASITVGGKKVTTNAAGRATAALRKGSYRARATSMGYVPGAARVAVR